MAIAIFNGASFLVVAKHVFIRNDIRYFSKRIPADMQPRFPRHKNGKIQKSLKTRDALAAAKLAEIEA
jgi:hypothetical protein